MTRPHQSTEPASTSETGPRGEGIAWPIRSFLIAGIPGDIVALLVAILFLAVIGAWIAKAYPESERRVSRDDLWPDNDPDEEESGA